PAAALWAADNDAGLFVAGRRHEAAERRLDQLCERKGGLVPPLRRDRLIADRKPRAREARRTDRRGQIDQPRIPGPEQLVGRRNLLAIHRNAPPPALALVRVVMRKRRGCGDRAEQDVVVLEERVE